MKKIKSPVSVILAVLILISTLLTGFSASAISMGDIDSNGKVTSTDAMLALQYSVGQKTLTTQQFTAADINGDKKVNSTDALLILRIATGLDPQPNPPQEFEPYKGTVTADPSLRLRAGAGTGYGILANIPLGTELTITAVNGNWGKTTYEGKTGWVSLDYISVTKPSSGTFTVISYGYGHGVGMSQYGAKYYADSGWTYDKILLHYYYSPKTVISTDKSVPATVKYGGQTIGMKQYLAGSVKAEMGDSWNVEAIKAQMVAIYTYAKYYNFNVSSSTHAYKSGYNYSGTKIETALNAVYGKYISYDGKAILSVYCSSMGGKNTSAKSTWLGSDIPYLQGGRTSPEPESITKKVYTYTAADMKAMVRNNLGVTLTGDPSTWFKDIVHDKSISSSVGYIISMNVGGTTVKGENVRTKLFKYQVRSHCLSITYNP